MALVTKAIKGTKDVLPKDAHKNQYIEATCFDIAERFGYKEIRTPVFEHAAPCRHLRKRCALPRRGQGGDVRLCERGAPPHRPPAGRPAAAAGGRRRDYRA